MAALPAPGCNDPPGVRPGADCVLVIVDTLRADALGCYGNPSGTSPHLDRLAERSARFAQCFAQAPNTATSHATLFTGLHPWSHRVANLTSLELGTPGLPDAFETLAERFSAAGYRTAAFTDGGPLGRTWNLCQGFEVLEARYEGVRAKVDGALAFLDARAASHDARPLFLLVHTYEVHVPYAPADEWIERFDPDYEGVLVDALAAIRSERAAGREVQPDAKLLLRDRARFTPRDWEHLRALYHAEVAYTDSELARLLERFGDGDAIVAVTSDHGEEFLEHGEVGHVQLHRETLHVPLLLSLPGGFGAGAVVSEPVGLIDLHATLLEAAGIPHAVGESRSLLALLRGERAVPRTLFAETTEHLYSDRPTPWRRSVRFAGQAFLSTTVPDGAQGARNALFDLGRDPGETNDLLAEAASSARSASLAGRARALLEEHLAVADRLRSAVAAGMELDGRVPTDEELARELEALGYVESPPAGEVREE